ncbi:hypothetical protein OG625_38455 [Streptomyces sp. NBC_01351]|uniref:hypothetical protein n=1 Tax=Streptomyces sp. NBC_01351 TaxID=2903833 RepID=UPI002E31D386|nr:hypothetical protein [Streptomyces sp. NBC_01351]
MPTLLELLQSLDEQPAGAVIYAAKPWTAASDAVAVAFDAPPSDLAYLLEVELAQDVLEVWSSWRNGAQPNALGICQAVIHYADHDAYLDVHH